MRRRLLSLAAVWLLVVLAGPSSGQAHADIGSEKLDDSESSACVKRAKAVAKAAWICSGDRLSYSTGQGATKSERVDVPISVESADPVSTLADDYDYWCESTGACARVT